MSLTHLRPPAKSTARIAHQLSVNNFAPPANDNAERVGNDATLQAALRHFAVHGLGAAQAAHTEATRALRDGDGTAAAEWTDICRLLDRRLAASLEPAGA